ncbi:MULTISPECIES: hypothetical protein [unclassified Oleiphilus]|uniref:hypothetical protein n=1 Tax=unclassified Oleiphilus TaxID=2631174 RepID=UPI0007C29114|nr:MULTISPECIES: hypothetical protein [unclassified Oleiphilus]KZY41285.1 hypothetical protein A3732_18410 [Oleiphilus sp. HI0050]KZZ34319.1 hypothetical protein A3757_17980 [Oleiphilus sp. HI0117]KZZ53293.1 hypothetical protein A3761_17540 [Oleiphilus sp. HI0123]
MKYLLLSVLLFFSELSNANPLWTPAEGSLVDIVNPGTRSQGATYFTLKGVSFSGCTKSTGTILWKDTNKNYNEIYSLLLAAKMANKKVRLYYKSPDGCDYPELIQAYML